MAEGRTSSEFQVAAAKRAAKRLEPLIAKLSPVGLDRLHDVVSALLVATDEEKDVLEKLIDAKPADKYEHLSAVARDIVAKHLEAGE